MAGRTKKRTILVLAAAGALAAACSGGSGARSARDYITVVGSSTVFPFTTAAAEQFGRAQPDFRTPKVEATGTGGGLKLFCDGVGVRYPDMANASRRIKQSELDRCIANGVNEVIELKIGFDGIVIAQTREAAPLPLSLKDLWLALAKDVPDPGGAERLAPNRYRTWHAVNASLPDVPIEVLGPPPTSGTRDAFAELALEAGCSTVPWIAALRVSDEPRFKAICHSIREDGHYVEAGENDNLIVQKLVTNPRALGVFGYGFLEQNLDRVRGCEIEGVAPEYEAIAGGRYPISRALYVYVKKRHVGVIPGIPEFLAELTSERALAEEGYLAEKGLIALPPAERRRVQATARDLEVLPAQLEAPT